MPSILGANSVTGYDIDNSLRFNDADSPKLSRSISSAGSTTNATISVWVKRGVLGTRQQIYSNKTADSAFSGANMYFNAANDRLYIDHHDGSNNKSIYTNMRFRDVGAWYHIVHAIDTTTGTATNRLRVYVNGTEITSFATDQNPSQNADLAITNATGDQSIGDDPRDNNDLFDGYMAEYNFVDGATLDPTSFGKTDDNGVWVPKQPTVGAYGTNGFFLQFKQTGTDADASGIGADTSGTGNHMTVTNLAATDVTTDTPTNNFATWNFLHKASNVTLSEGNCKAAIAGAAQSRSTTSTIAVSKGKWYCEIKYTADTVSGFFGLVSADIAWNINATDFPSSGVSDNVGFNDGGTKYLNGTSSSYGSGFGNNDTIAVAANLDDGEVVFYVNNTAENSGKAISKTFSGDYFFVVQHQSSSGTSNFSVNFGNPPHAISSGNSDANGYGNFEYAPPSGYYAVCTKNLAEFG